jgi:hypothetical protein
VTPGAARSFRETRTHPLLLHFLIHDPDTLGRFVPSPLYTAVITWMPRLSVLVGKDATPLTNGTVASVVAKSKNVTRRLDLRSSRQ